ncbi:hypothetical protein [Brevundimonas diminuta]|nr:hypothetical protein [Brevundimonas diminuta]
MKSSKSFTTNYDLIGRAPTQGEIDAVMAAPESDEVAARAPA